MILAGDENIFAIKAEIESIEGTWIYGGFQFVLHGQYCGNWEDYNSLDGSYGWLKDFIEKPVDRLDLNLLALPSNVVFEKVVDSVLARSNVRKNTQTIIENLPYKRFHISHVGMSSFDRVVMILIEGVDKQRCLWEEGGKGKIIHDDIFPSGHMQKIASEFCRLFEIEAQKQGGKL